MPILNWSEEFSIGNEEIDLQHKKWFEIYNKAHEKMMGNLPAENKKDIGRDALDEMIEYTRFHFKTEESLMETAGFSDIAHHKTIHRDFAKELGHMQHKLHSGEWVLNSEIIKTIENWLVGHIMNEDQKIFKP